MNDGDLAANLNFFFAAGTPHLGTWLLHCAVLCSDAGIVLF